MSQGQVHSAINLKDFNTSKSDHSREETDQNVTIYPQSAQLAEEHALRASFRSRASSVSFVETDDPAGAAPRENAESEKTLRIHIIGS
ncbi:MAG TPA: hypothetical protein VLJ86_15740 [Ramlibacter sp.]|nr:hypothetical protein [Ramlibacter sp.]